MLNKEVIQRIQNLYSKGVKSDDSRLTSRHIYNKLLSTRAEILRQTLNKKQKISDWVYQTLSCIELIEAEIHECPCIPPIGCKILKSRYPLPAPITSMDYHGINSVTSIDGNVSYSYTTWEAKKYKKASKYTSANPDYFIKNGYLFVTHKSGPKILSITGLFESPLDVYTFMSYCDEDCVDCEQCVAYSDLEFPLDSSMLETVIQIAVQELIGLFNQNREDQTNNTKDNLNQESK